MKHDLFRRVNDAALPNAAAICRRILPDGKLNGIEYVARNPRRDDHRPGSFKINVKTGRWADFATGDKGGDLIGLVAYLHGLRQIEAARNLAVMLGVDHD
ncbi:hypothetical protein [Caenispirillum bisanense]|uniref:DNA primase n=1 Tax=Caenispirillum bisanense TaxID=414052 RepID=A0A286GMZ1_9PROT|nr:hypothetical protein [Caenispirillum bisanense]SOD96546.1 hypothetical protein SAMN05421508_105407 [Caenispirillum bisanense]